MCDIRNVAQCSYRDQCVNIVIKPVTQYCTRAISYANTTMFAVDRQYVKCQAMAWIERRYQSTALTINAFIRII